jgi:hypothetical protein
MIIYKLKEIVGKCNDPVKTLAIYALISKELVNLKLL